MNLAPLLQVSLDQVECRCSDWNYPEYEDRPCIRNWLKIEIFFWDGNVKLYSAASHCRMSGEFVWNFRRRGHQGPSSQLYDYLK
jgi:hypothetical protein